MRGDPNPERGAPVRLPENFRDTFANSPNFYKRQKELYAQISEERWREIRAVYFALVSELDAQFGKMLDQLQELDALENTIIVLTTDHGRQP